MKLYKRVISGLRICFFNNYTEKNQNNAHFEEGTSEFPLPVPKRALEGKASGFVYTFPQLSKDPFLWESGACISYYLAFMPVSMIYMHICNHF